MRAIGAMLKRFEYMINVRLRASKNVGTKRPSRHAISTGRENKQKMRFGR
jgi:hypothetical protein